MSEQVEYKYLEYPSFDISLISLNQIIQVFILPDNGDFLSGLLELSVVSAAMLTPLLFMVTGLTPPR
ncbi:hypothetical protein JM238_004956 [Salmonella enterica]|nr:hypothetical protein [Salmonella enterica]